MILYKYYGFNSGLIALRNSQLGFRTPKDFNDPFELTFMSNVKGPDSKLTQMQTEVEELKRSVAILSLTRTPLNPLMWAHYGEGHTGFVIGYETNDKFLTSETYNLVTVNDGDVVYANTKNLHILDRESMSLFHQVYLMGQGFGLSISERSQINSLIRRVFLTKHSSWVYEEEVRVVKVWQSLSESVENYQEDPLRRFYPLTKDVAPGYQANLVSGLLIYFNPVRIKEVYLGVRNPLIRSDYNTDVSDSKDLSLVEKASSEDWRVRTLKVTNASWDLKHEPAQPEVLSIRKKASGLLNSFEISGQEAKFLNNTFSTLNMADQDKLDYTNWNGQFHLKVNGKFVGILADNVNDEPI